MKTQKNNLVEIVILGVLGLLVVLSILIPQLLRDRGEPRLLSLSVLLRDTDSAAFAAARQGMEQAADELGAELRFLTPTVQSDSREQAELLRREAEGGADALIVLPVDTASLSAALDQLSSPPPVVSLGSGLDRGTGTVTPDGGALGRALAQALLEDWDGGKVLLLDSRSVCPEAGPRLDAALEALVQAGVPAETAAGLPERGADWVMTFEPGATRRAGAQKIAEGLDFALYGVGSSTAVTAQLERRTISAVAAWSDYAAGYLAVRQAVQAVRGQPEELEPLSFFIVRGEDIYAPDNQKLLFPVTS
ncbi:MAG: sugar ABC transporter substrate-binding protein [Lawsonibacter sp.]|nr:sugar ABC transporter substrate-binding protein [Lawsonibacter sp.]